MSKSSIENYLSKHAFFSGLDDDFLKYLSDSAAERQLQEGDVLFQQGKPADKFYLVRKGQVSIQVPALMGPAARPTSASTASRSKYRPWTKAKYWDGPG